MIITPKPFVSDEVETIIVRRMPQGGYLLSGADVGITKQAVEAARSDLGQILELIETIWRPLDEELQPDPTPPAKPVDIGQVISFPVKAMPIFPPAVRTWEDRVVEGGRAIVTPLMAAEGRTATQFGQ
jgi:hypothetical protein